MLSSRATQYFIEAKFPLRLKDVEITPYTSLTSALDSDEFSGVF
jgi:hypothetical protein